MNHHAPIQDHQKYNTEMAKGMSEKLFFLDKIKADVWVDFGCGDGSILKAIAHKDYFSVRVGVEADHEQAKLAKRVATTVSEFSEVSTLLTRVMASDLMPSLTTAAIFSSVLHEAPELILQALDFGFDYIVIRDMALLPDWRHLERDLNAAFKLPYWGTPSWEREVSEDYFGLNALGGLVAPRGYRTVYFEHSAVPAIQDRIERDLGTRPEAPTHIKAIWKKVS